jgi:hypothetical protein
MQQRCNHAWSAQSGIKKSLVEVAQLSESSFETPACRDMSSGAEEFNSVESSELAFAEQ